jgi:putative pyruvate formate lyase activating enzyme
MPDFKLWSAERTRRYLAKRDHAEVARHSVSELQRQVGDLVLDEHGMARPGLIVRHLGCPARLDETGAILRFIVTDLGPGTYVDPIAQYSPAGRTGECRNRSPPARLRVRAGAGPRRRAWPAPARPA